MKGFFSKHKALSLVLLGAFALLVAGGVLRT